MTDAQSELESVSTWHLLDEALRRSGPTTNWHDAVRTTNLHEFLNLRESETLWPWRDDYCVGRREILDK